VWLQDVMSGEGTEPFRVLTTRDGGRTWSVAKDPPAPPREDPARSEAPCPRDVCWTVSQDEETVRVERRERGAEAQERARLPVRWRREGKRLVPER
jgi:hypothetical protein